MSFQITVLKVLAGHPEGRASLADLTRYVSVLISSGTDWTNRMKSLAGRAPKLDIFGDRFVLRDDRGWQITNAGRQFLASLETVFAAKHEQKPALELSVSAPPPLPEPPPLRLVVDNSRVPHPRRGKGPTLRSA